MFTGKSLRGWVLNRALHHQHNRIYNYDRSTHYGVIEKPSLELTKLFLDFVHYDQGGRIFTYVVTLDGQWRFTETGKEFGIDMLSKHTMHSDVSIYIAWSGEFFIRRLKHPHKEQSESTDPESATLPPAPEPDEEGPNANEPSKDPHMYEMIIDNDSGTYRPNAKYLPTFKEFMARSLPGLKVATLDCQADEEEMNKLKGQQRERKKKSGNQMTYMQNASDSSISSSDEAGLNGVREEGKAAKIKQGVKDPKAALMSAAADAAGPTHAVDHEESEKQTEKTDEHDGVAQTDSKEKPEQTNSKKPLSDGIHEPGINEKTALNDEGEQPAQS